MPWQSSTNCWASWRNCSSWLEQRVPKTFAPALPKKRGRVGSSSSQAAVQLRRRICPVEARALEGLRVSVGSDTAIRHREGANVAPRTGWCSSALDGIAVTGNTGEGHCDTVLVHDQRADAIQARSIFRCYRNQDRGAAEAILAVSYRVGDEVSANEVGGRGVDN